jgi:6-phosphogluconate dehydrogenase
VSRRRPPRENGAQRNRIRNYGRLRRGNRNSSFSNIGKQESGIDAETAPLRNPEHYQYDFDLKDITELWRRGSVIASWLLDLTAVALLQDPTLSRFEGRVSDSGEGRWTIQAAIEEGVPAPVLTSSLYERFSSRGRADFANKLLSAMRYQFGGHEEKG